MSYADELAAIRANLTPAATGGVLYAAEVARLRELITKHPADARQMLNDLDAPPTAPASGERAPGGQAGFTGPSARNGPGGQPPNPPAGAA